MGTYRKLRSMSPMREPSEVNDEDEQKAVQYILHFFKHFEEWEETLEKYKVAHEGSRLSADDAKSPHYPVSQYAYAQLKVAFGSMESLKQMLVTETDSTAHVSSGPFGPYPLVRNAMDCAALALWLVQPENGKARLKRRILAQLSEIHNAAQFRKETGLPSKLWAASYLARICEVADQAGVDVGKIEKAKMPTTTQLLTDVEWQNPNPSFSWLAAWQLTSAHAHGRQWASTMTHEVEEIAGTATGLSAEFRVTVNYGVLAMSVFALWNLLQVTCERYSALANS